VFAAHNLALNDLEGEVAQVDWRDAQALVETAPWDLVLAADVLYERANVGLLVELLPRLVDERGEVWLADPGRDPAEEFVERADRIFERRSHRSAKQPRVTVHRLRRR
jgi:predicted nicotinamide N-methyase